MPIRRVLLGLKALLRRDRRRRDLDAELRSYLDAAAADKMTRGMAPDEALRAARIEMGSLEAVKDEVQSSGWESAIESYARDVRLGCRRLRRSPGFSIVSIAMLALGIGATTAVFTVFHGVLLRPLPIAHPETLYRIGEGFSRCCEWGGLQDSWEIFDYPFYQHVSETSTDFEHLAAFSAGSSFFSVRRADGVSAAATVTAQYVSGSYFPTLGLGASIGRLLGPADDGPDAPATAVIGYRLWQRFGSDPAIVGAELLVNNRLVTVVGVAPPGFDGVQLSTTPPELWIALNQQPAFDGRGRDSLLYSSGMAWLFVIGRLEPDAHVERLESSLSIELQNWLRAQGRQDDARHRIDRQRIRVTAAGSGFSELGSRSRHGLLLLSVAAALVLLIACVNQANLLFARGARHHQRTLLSQALGATRGRLARAALIESLVLALIGGAVGILVAYGATRAILLLAFRGATHVPIEATPSMPVLGFALLLSVSSGLLSGVVPAWVGARGDLSHGLRAGSRARAGNSRPLRSLIVVQAVLSVLLLAVAGVVTESLRTLEAVTLGFDPAGRLLAAIDFKAAGYAPEDLPQAYERTLARLEQIPGVHSASLSMAAPQARCCVNINIAVGGRSDAWISDTNVVLNRVSPRYFETTGTPVLRGRAFSDRDVQDAPHVAVVDMSFARTFFPDDDAIGQRFGLSLDGHAFDYEIIGIVDNAKYRSPSVAESPMFFLPFTQSTRYAPAGYARLETTTLYANVILLDVAGDPDGFRRAFVDALADVDRGLSVVTLRTYHEQMAMQYNQERLVARLTSVLGLLALTLASVGLYGVTAYNVAERTAEIGVRVALGASRRTILGMIVSDALRPVCVGLCLGVPLSVAVCWFLTRQLYGVPALGPSVLGAAGILMACAALAGVLPARRAASIDPMRALRSP